MVVAAIISVGAGAALSHVIEPGVRVEKIMLTTNTPALRIFPATPGPHPLALLAHGCTGSKEMLFRFGEAALAGARRLRLPRWSLPEVTGILALGCLPLAIVKGHFLFAILMCALAISTLLLLARVAVGRIATRGGLRREGDISLAIFASCVIGEFILLCY